MTSPKMLPPADHSASDAKIPLQHARIGLDLRGRSLMDDVAIVDDVRAAGQRQRGGDVLLDQDDGLPGAARSPQARIRSCTITGARPSNGSSSRMIFGFRTRARAIASICCSPPDRSVPRLPRRSFSRGNIA